MTHNIPLIDPQSGIRLCGGSRALYSGLLRRFSLDQSIPRLRAALLDGDLGEAFLHAHSLKGLSAQLSLCALGASSGALCNLLREGQALDLATARRQLADLEVLHERTLGAIAQFIAEAQ